MRHRSSEAIHKEVVVGASRDIQTLEADLEVEQDMISCRVTCINPL